MPETTAQHLSRLHSLNTLTVDTSSVELRAKAIDALYDKAKVQEVVTAAAMVAGLVVDLSKIEWLTKPVGAADPSFAPVEVDKGVAVACCAMVSRLLAGDDQRSLATALVLLSARMGHVDKHAENSLNAAAHSCLWRVQRTPLPEKKYSPPAVTSASEQLQALTDTLSTGQVTSLSGPLSTILSGLIKAVSDRDAALTHAFETLSARQSAAEEEMRMHWWTLGKASTELCCPLAMLPIFEAATRAALDLAAMVSPQRPAGPFAAPALLERVLQTASGAEEEEQALASAIVSIPLEVRRKLFTHKPLTTVVPGAFPIMLAVECAIESGDEDDWKPRFRRIANVEPDTTVTPKKFAQQLYRELLLWTMLPA